MRILVLSDSHGQMRYMEQFVEVLSPDCVIHLGDMVRDGEALSDACPHVRFLQVAGNCDRLRVRPDFPEVRLESLMGVRIYMTHGHLHGVKTFYSKLMDDGIRSGADIILFGHTHLPFCQRLENGAWLMNPGECGYGATAGLIELTGKDDISCRIIFQRDLEAMR